MDPGALYRPDVLRQKVPTLHPRYQWMDIELDAETRARISALSPTPPPATDRNEEQTEHNYGSR